MRIRLVTKLNAPFEDVVKGFDVNLFTFLLPPLVKTKIIKYEGQNPGDIVSMRFGLPLFQLWVVIIKDTWITPTEYGFTDRALKAPLGILYWKHIHRVVAKGNNACFIIDDIEYETSFRILDYLIYIPLYFAFYPRVFLYQKYFRVHT